MPELPEVEITRRGIAPHVLGHAVEDVIVRDRHLRWPVPGTLRRALRGQRVRGIERRAKYLIFRMDAGSMILHLGMSGSLRVVDGPAPPGKHDHVDIVFDSGVRLRFRDPRRFGSIHWTRADPLRHKLLKGLGPEPLSETFDGNHLHARSRGRRLAVKSFLMDSRTLVGVGNIYANEALFGAGLHPRRPAGRISLARYEQLAKEIKQVLARAVQSGGTTLRDFVSGVGEPGYFSQELRVYDRAGLPCVVCGRPIRSVRLGQRSTFYCPRCQK
ncbi:MAG: bifunctional DNA-formamidopyrimidine glycosylase/DNA-(apurinic or apyrimidinic site) lyase [Gammaproteobacteria bacterium]|nr:bifunctional DNA-formamidopyrimidine glycosylase/DNA-(apurinic or apyrimidinic site) lyase [Gammaproteobacteria bacterium]